MKNLLIGTFSCKNNIKRVEQIDRLKIYSQCENQYYIISKKDEETFKPYNFISLDITDTYERLIFKTIKFLEYFVDSKFDFCFKCDDDSLVDIKRLRLFNYEKSDYAGLFINTNTASPLEYFKDNTSINKEFIDIKNYSFCVGGGYFLSKKAAVEIVSNFEKSYEFLRYKTVGIGCEDRMVGELLDNTFAKFNNGVLYSEEPHYSAIFNSVYHPISLDTLNNIKHRSIIHGYLRCSNLEFCKN